MRHSGRPAVHGGVRDAEPVREPQLDGLRGLAILLVVLYHVAVTTPPHDAFERLTVLLPAAGWSGVDLFFVLSGFLITRILLRERTAPNYYSGFYGRRLLRIFPAYYALLTVVLWTPAWVPGIASYWFDGADRRQFWHWLYLSNLQTALTGRFQHLFLSITWSLAIEEHFYLVWPFLVRRLSSLTLDRLCVAVVLLEPVARAVALASGVGPPAVYTLTPFRLDGLAVGAWIAIRFQRGDHRTVLRLAWILGPVAAAATLGWLTALAVAPGLGLPFPLADVAHPVTQIAAHSGMALAYGALLVAVLRAAPESRLRRAFASKALRVLGIYSYAIYLVHLPVIEAVDYWLLDPAVVHWPNSVEVAVWGVAVLVGSVAVAMVSWRLIEAPALRLRAWFPYGSEAAIGDGTRNRPAAVGS